MTHHPEIQAWLEPNSPPGLGPSPRSGTRAPSTLRELLSASPKWIALAPESQKLTEATVLIWNDHLEPAHRIVQELELPEAAYLHGIIHRREPDYWNAKYWFRRAGRASFCPGMATAAAEQLRGTAAGEWSARLLPDGRWDPVAFVDCCEQASSLPLSDPLHKLACTLQARELELSLLNHNL